MKTPPKLSSLIAHLKARTAIAVARSEAHARAFSVVAKLELAHDVRALDIEIHDLEKLLARISDAQEPQHHKLRLGPMKIDIVVSDRKQLGELVTVLKTWRTALLGTDGQARIELAEQIAARLAVVSAVKHDGYDVERPLASPNGRPPASKGGD